MLSLLLPEIITASLGVLVILLAVILPGKGEKTVQTLTVAGLVAVLFLAVKIGVDKEVLFNGIYIIDAYAGFFKILFLTGAILVILSSANYVKNFSGRISEFYGFMLFAVLGMMIMAGAGDLLTLYIALELMTISFYILVAYVLNRETSKEAGLKYLILGALSSGILLFGISLVYALTGTTVLSEIGSRLTLEPALISAVILILAGFGFKIALIPFHMWTPDIYEGAPINVTAFLAVASKAAGLAAMVRVFISSFQLGFFDWQLILALLAALTMIIGNLVALVQSNIKRLLAYSSIAQAGYLAVGLVAANEYGLKGILFYSMVYVFANLGAFAVAVQVENDTGSNEIKDFGELGKRSPFLAAVMTVCLLSLAGIPPLAGFVGKFYLFSGAVEAGYVWLAFIGLLMSMISVYYYLNVVKVMYIGKSPKETFPAIEPSARLALWICLLLTVFLGIYPYPLTLWTGNAVKLFLG
ncbi:NADH dehydrogenase subunit N [Thermosyntropha lipolytica DSM 11003]|uniref:NADH-quinone oxidoreductase subunit N n=1 Tax=Thermosyntropha lipolytica DSM 11003 TaxID=1123382 RepID=A0A1M5P496_9FIRM|nr:NADH-quinone oxidoreductase subunit N [Thermosyntropha lipolytica]SHG96610.1 NADH dehydrogenase subunit N [Thermosyntropha lipolytica DSM 11003]